jgi:hypothetical protein
MTGTITPPTLNQARATVTESLRGGTIRNPITHDDVLNAVRAIAALPPKDARALMAELESNGKLKTLVNEAMDGKSFGLGGLSAGQRQTFFVAMANSLDGPSLARLGMSFDAADRGFDGFNAAQDMAKAVATHGSAATKLDYIAGLATKSTDQGSVSSAGIGGSVSINADAEASAIGTVLASMRGANADKGFSSLSKTQLEAVILSSVNSTVSVSGGGMVMTGASVTASWNAKDFVGIMKAAQSVTNPATRTAIMEAAVGQYMNVMTAKNSLGYTVIGQPQTLNIMAAAIKGFSGGAKLPDPASVPVTKDELALDVLQISLDVIGIIEPTPFADGTNAVISLGRGDGLGAFLSAVGIVPYLGDLAKAGKLGKWAKTIDKAIDIAKADPAFLAKIRPALEKLNYALGKMGDAMPDALKAMKSKLDDLLRAGDRVFSAGVEAAAKRLGIPPEKVQELLNLKQAKADMPEPSSYLPASRIAEHAKAFEGGGSRLTLQSSIDDYGLAQRDGTTFILTKTEADRLIADAGGDLRKLEASLGLPAGQLDKSTLVRVDFTSEAMKDLNMRMPSGSEAGANSQWLPGGFLPSGANEAVIDGAKAKAGDYTIKNVN